MTDPEPHPDPGAAAALSRLLAIMGALRDPDTGCGWDLRQSWRTIAPYTIEEAYEVADAIGREDWDALADELGDLLFQVVYYAQLGREEKRFDFARIATAVSDKMVRRHPHVFGPDAGGGAPEPGAWERIKQEERAGRERAPERGRGRPVGIMAEVPDALPALSRAARIGARAARREFDWPDLAGVFAKLREELDELEAELDAADPVRLGDELGDVLFACANLARRLDLDPERCLREAGSKFVRRFELMERDFAAQARSMERATPEDREAAWRRAKRADAVPPVSPPGDGS